MEPLQFRLDALPRASTGRLEQHRHELVPPITPIESTTPDAPFVMLKVASLTSSTK